MKKPFVLTILLSFAFCFAFSYTPTLDQEEEIKKLIFDDLILLNDLLDKCLIQPTQGKLIIIEEDTLFINNTLASLINSANEIVSIVNVSQYISYFYEVEVRFNLISDISMLSGFLKENTFKYFVLVYGGEIYRINGFLISDILKISSQFKGREVRKGAKIKGMPLFFYKHLKYQNADKLRNYLSIAVIERYNKACKTKFSVRPYVRNNFCNRCFLKQKINKEDLQH